MISGQRGFGLRLKHARQNNAPARGDQLGQRCGKPLQRPKQDIGEHKIERRAPANRGSGDAARAADVNCPAGAIEPGVVLGDAHRLGIDIGCKNGATPRARGRVGQIFKPFSHLTIVVREVEAQQA